MGLFKQKSRSSTGHIQQIAPAKAFDVFNFQGTTLSIFVDITRRPFTSSQFSNRESKLQVKISNDGLTGLEDLSVEALAPDGTFLVDPGILFGSSRRHVRLPSLMPSKSVTYKLGLRPAEEFKGGSLVISVRENNIYAEKFRCVVQVPLTLN
jgi:hypothetical protein